MTSMFILVLCLILKILTEYLRGMFSFFMPAVMGVISMAFDWICIVAAAFAFVMLIYDMILQIIAMQQERKPIEGGQKMGGKL